MTETKAHYHAPAPPAKSAPPSDTLTLPVAGMTCAACVHHVTEAIRSVPGVTGVSVNLATERATITLAPNAAAAAVATDADTEPVSDPVPYPDTAALAAAVAAAGYRLDTDAAASESDAGGDPQNSPRAREERRLRMRLIIAAFAGAALFLGSFPALPWTPRLFAAGWWYPLLLCAVATPVQLWAGWPFYVAGWAGLRRLRPNMHTLIALGTTIAYGYSLLTLVLALLTAPDALSPGALHFDMAAVIIALVLLGRWLEARALSRTSDAISRLLDLRPQTAHLLTPKGAIVDVPLTRIAAGDTLAVRPGEHIPVDGELLNGSATVDESALTGESLPVDKAPGDALSAGTLNGAAAFTMRALRIGSDTTLAQIIRLVEEAQGSAAPVQRLVDRVAAWFVPAVGAVAIAAAILWLFLGPEPPERYAMMTLVAVFIIACPCALGLATPTAIIVGVGRAARQGILIRSAAALETAHRVTVVALDKTGTLTAGHPQVTAVIPAPGANTDDVLRWAAAAEQLSEHPIGRAIVRYAQTEVRAPGDALSLPPASDFVAHPGAGVTARVAGRPVAIGNAALMAANHITVSDTPTTGGLDAEAARLAAAGSTPLFVAAGGQLLGLIAVSDAVQPGAPAAVAALRARGIRVVMLTGDRPEVAAAVAARCGIAEYHAAMLPADKDAAIARWQAEGSVTAMVGDGINDAPALARADVGIAMGAGSDIARATADITLMRNDLAGVPAALALSRATMRAIRQNLFWAFFYNTILIPVAAGALYPLFAALGGVPDALAFFFGDAGFLNPILAALAMAFSSVSVVANSLRLRRGRAS